MIDFFRRVLNIYTPETKITITTLQITEYTVIHVCRYHLLLHYIIFILYYNSNNNLNI